MGINVYLTTEEVAIILANVNTEKSENLALLDKIWTKVEKSSDLPAIRFNLGKLLNEQST